MYFCVFPTLLEVCVVAVTLSEGSKNAHFKAQAGQWFLLHHLKVSGQGELGAGGSKPQ